MSTDGDFTIHFATFDSAASILHDIKASGLTVEVEGIDQTFRGRIAVVNDRHVGIYGADIDTIYHIPWSEVQNFLVL